MTARWLLTPIMTALATAVGAVQSPVVAPENKYTPAQDVEIGRDAAAEAEKQLPIMTDRQVTTYLERLGGRLVAAIPDDLDHREFRYTFQAVNVRDVNAFALPGGPTFVNRGMIQASRTEGEIASVMAHELSHVMLRHGTAQAGKATKYELGAIAGAIAGAIIGGRVGSVVAQGTQFGLGTAFLRFGREYERQADIAGAQLMARAGYDPREMATMFKTLESKGGSGGPEWMSSHPNPGNRADYILEEAATLRMSNRITDAGPFRQVKSHLESLPRAPTTEQATKDRASSSPRTTGTRTAARVEAPSGRYTEYNEGDLFNVSVPSNWNEHASAGSVTFAPDGAYANVNDQGAFSHGVEIGIGRNETHNLRTATEELLASLARGNPGLGRPSSFRNVSVAGRRGLTTTVVNAADSTAREVIQVVTTQLSDGNLLYVIAVSPEDEARAYQPVFNRVVASLRLRE